MLKKQSDSDHQSMTIQNLDSLDTENGETMQNISDKPPMNNAPSQTKNGHISFSVASLLADTRPNNPSPQPSEDDYDSNQEDSIVDVEDLNSDEQSYFKSDDKSHDKCDDNKSGDKSEHRTHTAFGKETSLNQSPIRPTPFSALAAAVYQAAHPNWAHQGLVNPFAGPGPMFQGPGPFGVPNINAGT